MKGEGPHALAPDDRCPSRSGTSETRGEAALRLFFLVGLALAPLLMLYAGIARHRAAWLAAAAGAYVLAGLTYGMGFALLQSALCLLAAALAAATAIRWGLEGRRGTVVPARP